MEFRSLRYFLMIAREGTILGAAKVLHVSQPALSRQMKDLERELGCTLFTRGSRRIELTEAGIRLRKRAEEIVDLMERTESDFLASGDTITGEVRIGGGETPAMTFVAEAIEQVLSECPHLSFNLYSGNGVDVGERLDMGRLDFGLFVGNVDHDKYEALKLPMKDTWGVIMRKDSPLASHTTIKPDDLYNQPLILSQQALNDMSSWFGKNADKLNVVATYNLLYNASILVSQSIGYALSLDGLVASSTNENALSSSVGETRSQMLDITFRPLEPPLKADIFIAWKRYQSFSPAAGVFLEKIKEMWQ